MTKEKLRNFVWEKTLALSIEMQYKNSQFLKGKYEAYKEMWDELGGDHAEPEEDQLNKEANRLQNIEQAIQEYMPNDSQGLINWLESTTGYRPKAS